MLRNIVFALSILFLSASSSCSQGSPKATEPMRSNVVFHFSNLLTSDPAKQAEALTFIEKNWQDSYTIMAIETIYLLQDPSVYTRLVFILEKKTGKNYGVDFDQWYDWIWKREETDIGDYADFKAQLYKRIDPRFEKYFAGRYENKVRLDEVRWGGVLQDGIPPLRGPKMIESSEADYLDDSNVVFGIEVNGDVRAYPKRILAWHEMFVDEVGGVPVCGVYCTLCGTVILYNTVVDGKNYKLGTSGFLYRSNKLMYDKATQSLWNTVWGEPVIGPLKDEGIKLEYMSVVTTTWGEWKRRHPETKVLSLETGHRRDYGEGVAYRDYFASDELMFTVPEIDFRLKNKDEVLALRLPEFPNDQLAISAKFLRKNTVYHDKIGTVDFVVLTDETGGNRVYATKGLSFDSYDGKETVTDSEAREWVLYEDRLERPGSERLDRLPYHRAFWFGWRSAYPDTRLVK